MTRLLRFGVGFTALGVSDPSWIDRIRRIEGQGYSAVSVADHPAFETDGPFASLAAAAMVTTSLRLGTRVLANDFRHPLLVAREIATIDQLSGGRVELGLGAGWLASDYTTCGAVFDPAGVRIARLEEALRIVELFFAGEPFSYAGEHYRVSDVTCFPRPVQHPRPPILVGGGGPRLLAAAARHADIVALNDNLGRGVHALTERTLDTVTYEATLAKLEVVRGTAGERWESIELGQRIQEVVLTHDRWHAAERIGSKLGASPDAVLASPSYLIGEAADVADQLRRLRAETGISYIMINERASDEMAPVVAAVAGS